MRLPTPPNPLRLLPTRCATLLASARRYSSQLIVLAVTSGGLALTLHQPAGWDVVADVAQVGAASQADVGRMESRRFRIYSNNSNACLLPLSSKPNASYSPSQ